MGPSSHAPVIIAHRGFHAGLPENTILAFVRAAELGFDGIETDVQVDRTGTPILFHDQVLRDGRPVKALSRDELSDAVGYQVPLLAQALDAVNDMVWDIEVKNMAAVIPTAKVLRDFIGTREVFISSFIHAAVRQLVENLRIRGALLVAHCPDGALLLPAHLIPGVDTIVWNSETVDKSALEWAASMGLRNMVYGYRPDSGHAAFLGADVEAVITDFSESLRQRNWKMDRS
jgi:glycerophosphoryl diester phosphodiesterase